MRTRFLSLLVALLCANTAFAATPADILQQTGVSGGIIVHIGCDDPAELAALRANPTLTVHGLDTDPAKVDVARKVLSAKNLNGPVSAAVFDGRRLPYIDNLINLVIVDSLGSLSADEVLRVVTPLGVAWIEGEEHIKPWPAEMDEWPQYLRDADNNAVSQDKLVGPPRHLQWVADPAWSRSHMSIPSVTSMVTAGGRLFTIEDKATPENPFLPGRFSLVARDAFNGTVLWEHAFETWEPITRYVKDVTVQLQRRLAAIGDRVYCTPALNAPITVLDAKSGRVLDRYDGTEDTQEFAYHAGVLYAVVGDRMNAADGSDGHRYDKVKTHAGKGTSFGGTDPNAPFDGAGFAGTYTKESTNRDQTRCGIIAIEATTGMELWSRPDVIDYVGGSLALQDEAAVFMTEDSLVCVDAKTGEETWVVEKPMGSGDGTRPNVVVISGRTVYTAEAGKRLGAYSLTDGHERWQGSARNNYEKTADLFVVDGSPWVGGAGAPTSHDPETGREIQTHQQIMQGPMGHDRCYRNFITETYYINSKTGGADFVNLLTGQEFPNHWLRGTCGMGTMPAGGLLYAPPYSCQCSMGAMIKNFNALYTEPGLKRPDQPIEVVRKVRLVRGPTYGDYDGAVPKASEWPVYRNGNARGGTTEAQLPTQLTEEWQVELPGGTPSAPIIVEGKLILADVDAHTIHALDAKSGQSLWSYVAGARVDSPPTYYEGVLLFGARDGWVHCLEADDGSLVWKFKDLPDKLISAFGQLESAWPINGSILIENDTAYFAAGRSSFLDGGIFLYALDPRTGEVKNSRGIYGPFEEENGFPMTKNRSGKEAPNDGFKGDIFVSDGELLYLRHRPFNLDLTSSDVTRPHLMPSAGFVDSVPQHRTYWTVNTTFGWNLIKGIDCDILVADRQTVFGVQGFPTARHSYFDPRKDGYRLFAANIAKSQIGAKAKGKKQPAAPADVWSTGIPLTGKAMVKAGDTLCIAGTPMSFAGNPWERYLESYEQRLGGTLWLASAEDGSKLGEYALDAPPRWDAMAVADGRLYIALSDGSVRCLGGQ